MARLLPTALCALALALTVSLGGASGAEAANITLYNVPAADSGLKHIAAGPDGALWFTERQAGNVGRITTAGQISQYPIPNDASGLEDTGRPTRSSQAAARSGSSPTSARASTGSAPPASPPASTTTNSTPPRSWRPPPTAASG